MFEEARGLRDPYFQTKHQSEAVVRAERHLPWRIYRPGIVVGHSQTGEMDKVDGPYYFFKLLQKLGAALPAWWPLIGIEGGPLNLVPVDFVARAMDQIAHADGQDGRTFHLVDPQPKSVAETLNVFARVAHAPRFALRFDLKLGERVPSPIRALARGPLRLAAAVLGSELGIPPRILSQGNPVTHFDCSQTTDALAGTGIEVPPLEDYADRLWKQWESNHDAELGHSRSLKRAVKGRRVLITGASSGIGRAAALKLGAAGAEVLLVARSAEKLERVKSTIERAGGVAHVYAADLSDLAGSEVLGKEVIRQHGGVDVLVNNAGRSIRRSLELSQDRFHDFERTMQLNYFGALKMILAFLPSMREQKRGHIVNVSSIGVQANTPRFSAYVASKAALDAFSRSAAAELVDEGISITTTDDDLRLLLVDHGRAGGRPDLRRSGPSPQAREHAARHLGRALVRQLTQVGRPRAERRLPAVPRLRGGAGRGGRERRGGLRPGRGLHPHHAGRALVAAGSSEIRWTDAEGATAFRSASNSTCTASTKSCRSGTASQSELKPQ
jgi:NADP-dependent 3-hydroxy acid dehydrogenase YdfG